jgi:hypothetical protein
MKVKNTLTIVTATKYDIIYQIITYQSDASHDQMAK